MSGIYIHIPFCKQACHYCDFHFSTQLKKKVPMLGALKKELELRKNELEGEQVDTIYFGGGTPSVLETDEINALIETIYDNYQCAEQPEITLEANPDDLSKNQLQQLGQSPINRLSIGIQSFFEEDLRLMNRAHDAAEARSCIEEAKSHFDNVSIDLIYGIPGMDDGRWLENIRTALSYDVPHISSYALTVEPKTALKKFIDKGIVDDVDDEQAQRQFHMLLEQLEN
ncbi:MAG: radical SAM protein, partial [Bacteroidota bacterium]